MSSTGRYASADEEQSRVPGDRQPAAGQVLSGLIDGLTVSLAILSGWSTLSDAPRLLFAGTLSVCTVWGLLLGVGAWLTARKEALRHARSLGFRMAVGYIAGALLATLPFAFLPPPSTLIVSATGTLLLLGISGYFESSIHSANKIAGAARSIITAAVLAGAAFAIGSFFS